MSHIRSSHGASALDVSKEGPPPAGAEPDEVHPEGAIHAGDRPSLPMPSNQVPAAGAPEIVLMPGGSNLESIPENGSLERETPLEPEPPPSTA
eukprot:4973518-Amphidinium_carterae.1